MLWKLKFLEKKIEEIHFSWTFFVIDMFWKLQFLKHLKLCPFFVSWIWSFVKRWSWLKGHFWSVTKVVIRIGCATWNSNLNRTRVIMEQWLQKKIKVNFLCQILKLSLYSKLEPKNYSDSSFCQNSTKMILVKVTYQDKFGFIGFLKGTCSFVRQVQEAWVSL